MNKIALDVLAGMLLLCVLALALPPKGSEEAEIRALYDTFGSAFRGKNADKIMSLYVPGQKLVAFDVTPPREYVGWNTYKKSWQDFFALFNGPPTLQTEEMTIGADGNLGYFYGVERTLGTLTDGSKMDITVRVTRVFRKVGGKWLIVHEHVSVPVDLTTGKPDLHSEHRETVTH